MVEGQESAHHPCGAIFHWLFTCERICALGPSDASLCAIYPKLPLLRPIAHEDLRMRMLAFSGRDCVRNRRRMAPGPFALVRTRLFCWNADFLDSCDERRIDLEYIPAMLCVVSSSSYFSPACFSISRNWCSVLISMDWATSFPSRSNTNDFGIPITSNSSFTFRPGSSRTG